MASASLTFALTCAATKTTGPLSIAVVERTVAARPRCSKARGDRGGAWSTAAAGSLEHFLVERYSLFAMRRGRMLRGDVRHQPWQLARADVRIDQCDMAQLIDFKLQGEPASALAARPIEVEAARPVLA